MMRRLAVLCPVWSSVPRKCDVVVVSLCGWGSWVGHGVWLAGHGGEGGGDFLQACSM
jgi:hypothetical protein